MTSQSSDIPRLYTIAWDVDDVLNRLTRGWFEWASRMQSGFALRSYDDLDFNPPLGLPGLDTLAYLESLDRYREEELSALAPCAEVLAWFHSYGSRCRHLAVSAVPLRFAPAAAKWVLAHFGTWIRTYHVLPSSRPDCPAPLCDHDKGQALLRLGGADVLVDDLEENAEAARRAGVETVLFPQPWNRNRGQSIPSCLAKLTALLP